MALAIGTWQRGRENARRLTLFLHVDDEWFRIKVSEGENEVINEINQFLVVSCCLFRLDLKLSLESMALICAITILLISEQFIAAFIFFVTVFFVEVDIQYPVEVVFIPQCRLLYFSICLGGFSGDLR